MEFAFKVISRKAQTLIEYRTDTSNHERPMRQFFIFLLIFSMLCASSEAAAPVDASLKPLSTPAKNPAPATVATQETPEGRLWNLQDADILSIINEVSLETGKNFVVDPRVSGKISLISSKPLKPDQVYDVFLSVLGILGYSAVTSGNVVKIIPNMESGEYATRVADRLSPGKGDEIVVRVIPLENISANQIIPTIRPMLPQWSNVSSYAPGNVIILLGRAGNLNRIIDVIRRIDRASNSSIDVIPLHRASASQVASVLSNLQNAGRANGDVPQISIAADERTNSILLGGNQSARARMRCLVTQLDNPASGSQGNTEVIYLKYLQAKTFAPTLGKIAQNMLGKNGGGVSDTDTSTTAAPAATTTTTTVKAKLPENYTNIQAEPSTNSLIITAPPSIMTAIRTIVTKLDIRPAQVLVEAIIVEMDENDLKNLGIQWGSTNPNSNNNNAAQFSTIGAASDVTFPPLGAGTYGIIPGVPIRAVLSALQNKTGVNILSTPSVVVLDNRKATLSVGQNIAIQNGAYSTTGSTATVTPFNTFDRKDVVLKLVVTPQINLGNAVRLTLSLSNDTLQNPINPGLNPNINTSKIENSVIINSKDVLVLGGLMSNSLTESVDKVPILGDIPLVGNVFKHTNREYRKKNLIVFIKPMIMYSSEDAETITNTKYNLTRNAQITQAEDIARDSTSPRVDNVLPLWKNNVTLPKPFEN